MKTRFLTLILLFVITIPMSIYSQGKFTLKSEEVSDATSRLAAISQSYTMAIRQKPEALKGVPEKISDKTLYYSLLINGKNVFLAIDFGETNPPLYADTNADGNLAYEKPITGATKDNRTRYVPVKIATISIGIDVPQGGYIFYSPAEIRRGDVTFGDETFSLMIADKNLNGRYNDFSTGDPGASYDSVGIDLNRNGTLDAALESGEVSSLAEAISVKDNYYSIKPSANGNTLEIKTLKPKMGMLDVQNPDMEISTQSKWGAQTFSGSNGKWELPEGKYITRLIRLKKKDDAGREWVLKAYSFYAGKLASFDIKSGKTTIISAGTPLHIVTSAKMTNDTIEVSASFLGRAGEQYSSGPTVDGQRPEPPKFIIVDKSGKELASGPFQYG